MTPAQSLLVRGLSSLSSQLSAPFTVDGFRETFRGLWEETTWSNELGEGGYIPDASGTFQVATTEFERVGIVPYPGMRVTLDDRVFIVQSVSRAFNKWRLGLTIGHPKESDLPDTYRVIATASGVPIQFTAGLVAIDP